MSESVVALLARLRVFLGFVFGAIVLWRAEPTPATLVVGAAVASGSLLAALLVAAYLAVTLTAAVKSEEAFLRRRFGDKYDHYRRGDLAKGDDRRNGGDIKGDDNTASDRASDNRRFSLAQAIANREYRALIGFLLAVLLLALKATYN